MFCPDCGKENTDNKYFCGNCGTCLVRSPTNKPVPLKSKNNNFIIGLIVFIILGAIFYNPIMGYLNTNYLGKPSLHIGEFNAVPDFWSGEIQFKFQVYNSGNGAAKNVYATIGIEDAISGKSLTSKQVYVGNLNPGESKDITAGLPSPTNLTNIKYSVSFPPDWLR